jgi:hypothetical protein
MGKKAWYVAVRNSPPRNFISKSGLATPVALLPANVYAALRHDRIALRDAHGFLKP